MTRFFKLKDGCEPAACLLKQNFHTLTDSAIRMEMNIFDWALLARQQFLLKMEAFFEHFIIKEFHTEVSSQASNFARLTEQQESAGNDQS